VHLPAVGERAAQLAWLSPDAHSLAILAVPPSPLTWLIIRRDPGILLLYLRRLSSFSAPSELVPEQLLEPRLLESALALFQRDGNGWIDWRRPSVLPIYLTALAIAHLGRLIAVRTHCCDERLAWTAGMLVPLGWFAAAAIDPSEVGACRSDPMFPADPIATQQACWGLDHAAIARRLALHWQLPEFMRAIVANVDLPLADATAMGADPMLFATIQLAVVLAARAGYSLELLPNVDEGGLRKQLGIKTEDLTQIEDCFAAVDFAEAFEPEWLDPRERADLPATMRSAADRRRAAAAPFLEHLENELDRLHGIVGRLRNNEEERVRSEKLAALAEFAAGASHEINNPLAVISGQSQYLLKSEHPEPQRRALESIVRQTVRIHAILAELMQFARPPRIESERISINQLLISVVDTLRGVAHEFGVALSCVPLDATAWIDGDPRQLRTAIGCLARNAIEAAAIGKGWARVGARVAGSRVEIVVEDNGAGLAPSQCQRMFDPFFSGRVAGRGRGLGLPTAWRLAHEHGGDVCLEPAPGGPTRFVLSLPLADTTVEVKRKSA
jgi:two-component system, NtrC family, sensor kinase